MCTMCEGLLDEGPADEGTSCEGAEHEYRLEINLIINNKIKGTAGSKNLSCLFGNTKWNRMKTVTPMKIVRVSECCGATNVGDECPEDECLRRREMRKTIVTTGKM